MPEKGTNVEKGTIVHKLSCLGTILADVNHPLMHNISSACIFVYKVCGLLHCPVAPMPRQVSWAAIQTDEGSLKSLSSRTPAVWIILQESFGVNQDLYGENLNSDKHGTFAVFQSTPHVRPSAAAVVLATP